MGVARVGLQQTRRRPRGEELYRAGEPLRLGGGPESARDIGVIQRKQRIRLAIGHDGHDDQRRIHRVNADVIVSETEGEGLGGTQL